MRKLIFTAAIILFTVLNTFAQNLRYEYPGKLTFSVKKHNLENAMFISEVTSDLWRKMILPYKERVTLEEQRKKQGYYIYLEQDNYKTVVDYISVELWGTCNGKNISAKNTSDRLTPEQKRLLNTADQGTDIIIKIKFRYKYPEDYDPATGLRVIEGELPITVVPETQAEYPGGLEELSYYLKKNIIEKVAEPNTPDKLKQVLVKFTVNEKGEIADLKIAKSSADTKTDHLLFDAIYKMQKWKPARNSKGINVKQEFSISFDSGC